MNRQLGMLWGASVLVLVLASPWASGLAGAFWACPFKAITGWPCPSCGTARAAVALAKLDVWGALVHYPLPTLGWLGFLGGGLAAMGLAVADRPLPAFPRTLSLRWRLSLAGLVLAGWVYSILTGV